MAEQVILDVKLDAGTIAQDLENITREITNLRVSQKLLDKDLKEGNISFAEYDKQTILIKDRLKTLQTEQKGVVATTKLLTAETDTYNDSLNGQRQKLADMYKAYDQLDKAQRESAGGQAFLKQIQEQSEVVSELESATGRHQRNVGNYPKVLTAIIPGFDKVNSVIGKIGLSLDGLAENGTKSLSTLGASVRNFGKLMITPPIALIVGIMSAILLVVQKLTEAIRKNDDASTALQRAFSALQPIVTLLSKVFEALAVVVTKVIEQSVKGVTAILNLIPAYRKAAEAADQLVVSQDKLEDKERDYVVNQAERNKEIARLREEAASTKDLDARKKALSDAIEFEKQNLADDLEIKKEKLRILEEMAKQEADTSDETKTKIAQARAAMYQSEEAYFTGTRRLVQQITNIDAEANTKRIAAAKQAEEEKRRNAEEIARQAEDFALSLIEDETQRAIATRKLQGQREIAELQNKLDNERNLTEQSREQLAQLIKDKQASLDAELEQMATDAANAKSDAEYQAEQERAQRILELRLNLTAEGSAEELEVQKALLDLRMEQELENAELTEEEKLLIKENYNAQAEQLDKQYFDALKKQATDAKEAYRDALLGVADNAQAVFGALSDLVSTYGDNNEKAARAQKAFAAANIIVDQAIIAANTAKAISEAVAAAIKAAGETGLAAPFTAPVFIAEMTGIVLSALAGTISGIAQAKQLLGSTDAGKFAGGGVVGGTSYTGDKLIAHVNSGEGIYTNAQANTILQKIANNPTSTGFNYEQFAEAVAAGVAAQPAPILDFQEFTNFEQKTTTIKEFAKI